MRNVRIGVLEGGGGVSGNCGCWFAITRKGKDEINRMKELAVTLMIFFVAAFH